jgi:hypothetical protein
MVIPLLVAQDARQSFGDIAIEPGIDGVRVAVAEQSLGGDRIGRQAVGDLEQRGAFADIGVWVMVTVMQQLVPLRIRKRKRSALGHGNSSPEGSGYPIIAPLPNLAVNTHKVPHER